MSVTGTSKAWQGSGGTKSLQARSYTVYYRAVTDDANDGIRAITEHFEDTDGLPSLGDHYTYEGTGTNLEDSGVTLWKISPSRDLQSATSWNIALHYKTPDEPGQGGSAGGGGGSEAGVGEDEDGNPTDDPVEFHGDVDISFIDFTRPVDQATYRSGLSAVIDPGFPDATPSEALYGGADTVGPVVNSAMIPFNPPLERNATRISIVYSKNLREFPVQAAAQFHRAVNDDAVEFEFKFQGLKVAIEPFRCQCVSINGTFQESAGDKFWRVTWELLIDDEFGFRANVVDRGLHARMAYGDPDGRGGTITDDPAVPWRRLTDKNGNPLSEPVLLNGNGQPLTTGRGGAMEPVYLTYSIYPEKPFWMLGIPIAGP